MTDPSDPTALTRLVTAEEREAAVERLAAAFADDALSVEEFERRVDEAWRATTANGLVALTRDLPAAGAVSVPTPAQASRSVDGTRTPERRISSVMSSVERRVDGLLPQRLIVRSVLGHVELDLRDAVFPPGVTEIRVRAVLGNIELVLPPDVEVEDQGRTFLGNFAVRTRGRRNPVDSDGRLVRIVGRSILSNIEVERGEASSE